MQKTAPAKILLNKIFRLKVGKDYEVEDLVIGFEKIGYERCQEVKTPGQICWKGGVVDLYPLGEKTPKRLEFTVDTLTSIRSFDKGSQRSKDFCDSLEVFPGCDVFLDDNLQVQKIYNHFLQIDLPTADRNAYIDEVKQGNHFHGFDFLLPDCFDKPETFLDYLESSALLVFDGPKPKIISSYKALFRN